jgi:predicted nucleic acid-binding Zn ribbon protein
MPFYEYKCQCSPDETKTFERSIKDAEPEYNCEKCNAVMTRHYGSFGIQFKGTGFYKTDNS